MGKSDGWLEKRKGEKKGKKGKKRKEKEKTYSQ